MTITENIFGIASDGSEIRRFSVANSNGYTLACAEYGATLISFRAPDRAGDVAEITLGYDELAPYLAGHPFFGSTIGRVANRIGGASFDLHGTTWKLEANEPPNTLHSGTRGFHAVVWSGQPFQNAISAGVLFSRRSPHGEQGFPGTLDVAVSISLTEQNELIFEYRAETDRPTPVNLTNHAYWNLAGAAAGEVYDHLLTLHCSRYLAVDEELIPTGEILSVEGTALDFRRAKPLGRDIGQTAIGYDHCLLIDRPEGALAPAARLYDPSTGRGMEISTTMPAIQLYTGNYLDGIPGAGGAVFRRHEAVCLETELYPDAVNHPGFPTAILRPGEVYHHVTRQRFFVE